MVSCEKCGIQLPEAAKYCPRCGKSAGKTIIEEFEVTSDELVKRIKEILGEGNATRIVVENEQGKTLLEIPVTIGLVGVLLAPWLAALGAVAAIATKCRIRVEKQT